MKKPSIKKILRLLLFTITLSIIGPACTASKSTSDATRKSLMLPEHSQRYKATKTKRLKRKARKAQKRSRYYKQKKHNY